MLLATAACNFATSGLPKVVREWSVLHILTCKCASRYSGVQFFHIPTSKSGPRMVCFAHFNLQMRFSLQRREIFPPNPSVFLHFDLQMCFSLQPSKSGPKLVCFVHFDFKMRFTPQRRAIFLFPSKQVPPHPPLYRAYFSTQVTHKSLKKHSDSRLA